MHSETAPLPPLPCLVRTMYKNAHNVPPTPDMPNALAEMYGSPENYKLVPMSREGIVQEMYRLEQILLDIPVESALHRKSKGVIRTMLGKMSDVLDEFDEFDEEFADAKPAGSEKSETCPKKNPTKAKKTTDKKSSVVDSPRSEPVDMGGLVA